ncbi:MULTISPECIES: hypothetical protein [Pandoraea]|uniref:hypothetical protein n=1 Tax=Pandoraea TaxID=93217 RepID=UPI001F5C708A|nr:MULTISPECIES: hypothetical protein [Pandoraea]MCI3206171.1 hypothetical protein [Pandoraea sp. LA3]MDN4584199.1 hypothetical protein [Pandoraea capi]
MQKIPNRGLQLPSLQVTPPTQARPGATHAPASLGLPTPAAANPLLSGLPVRARRSPSPSPDAVDHSDSDCSIEIVIEEVEPEPLPQSESPGARRPNRLAPGLDHNNLTVFGAARVETEVSDRPTLFKHLQPLDGRHAGEDRGVSFESKVMYLKPAERSQFKVSVQDGLMIGADGRPIDTRDASRRPGKTPERAIFVMDRHGDIYLSKTFRKGLFHHSSFLAGQPVAAAGDIRIENGKVTDVSRTSGHYQPTSRHLQQFVDHLTNLGVPATFHVHDSNATPADSV